MATKSGALAIGVGFSQIAAAAVGQEAVVFGLVFSNSTGAVRTVTLRLHVQATGTDVDIPFEISAKGKDAWDKAIGLQPGDSLSVSADAVGVGLIYSTDVDDGSNPVATALVPRGPYSAASDYDVNHYVESGGSAWVSLADGNIGNDPATSPAFWMLFAEVPQAVVDASVAAAMAAASSLSVSSAPGAPSIRAAIAAATEASTTACGTSANSIQNAGDVAGSFPIFPSARETHAEPPDST